MQVKIAMIPSEIINILNIIIKISKESLIINTSLSGMPIYHTPSFMVDAVPTQKRQRLLIKNNALGENWRCSGRHRVVIQCFRNN
jgi:hypothetical protein